MELLTVHAAGPHIKFASGASGVDFLVADDQRYNAEDGEDLVALVCILHFNRVYLFAKIQQVVLASSKGGQEVQILNLGD